MLDKAREVIDDHRQSFRRAVAAGVRIATGTDSGVTPHGRNLREPELMRQGGMSPERVLVATTRTAAELLGVADKLGMIEPGKRADLVMVEGDPLEVTTLAERTRTVGGPLSFDRIDGAPEWSVQLARERVYTAAINGMAANGWWKMVKNERSLVDGFNEIDRSIIISVGGLPAVPRGELTGAIGVSGKSDMEEDEAIAQTGIDEVLRWRSTNSQADA